LAIHEAMLDPQFFCEQENYYHHAEAYANEILKGKPEELKSNDFLNRLYAPIKGKKRRT
jgi:hypothetical protein